MRKPSLREWVNENRSELSDRFAEKYGNQIQEWADFAEYEFDQVFPRGEANISPASSETYPADELVHPQALDREGHVLLGERASL